MAARSSDDDARSAAVADNVEPIAVRRKRAELVGQSASALRFLAELRLGADRRARDLEALLEQLADNRGLVGEFLSLLRRDLDAVAEAARRALENLEGVSLADLADRMAATEVSR